MQGVEELLRHAVKRQPLGQAATNATTGKRMRDDDGEHTALAANPKEGGNDWGTLLWLPSARGLPTTT